MDEHLKSLIYKALETCLSVPELEPKHRLWACQIGIDLIALEQRQEKSRRRRGSGDDLVPNVDGLISMVDWEALENFDIPE